MAPATNWRNYTWHEIDEILSHEKPHLIHAQAEGWTRLSELMETRWLNLHAYRNALEERWHSEGGRAVLGKVDLVIGSLKGGAPVAKRNAATLHSIAVAVDTALRSLYELQPRATLDAAARG
ncbi:MAG: hypothetical protein ACRDT4_23800 [Micromonosporaceae bacterium]